MVIRNSHPGPKIPPYSTFEEKSEDALLHKETYSLPWTVLVDDLEGTAHQVYGGIADPTYLIGADGRVSFYATWTNVPLLNKAIEELLEQGGTGVVLNGVSRIPQLGPAMTKGWAAIRRGLPQSYIDLETSGPGAGTAAWLGYKLRPLLSPLTLRIEPLPAPAKAAMAGMGGLLLFALLRPRRSDRK